jgi:hypothetical protein
MVRAGPLLPREQPCHPRSGLREGCAPDSGNVDYGISDQLGDLIKGNAGNSLGAEIARRAFGVWWISPLRAGHAFGPPLA